MVWRVALLVAAAATAQASAPVIAGDARRGEEVFRAQGCVECHRVRGTGAVVSRAPDLGLRQGRDMSPAAFAALMWNHAPTMWKAMDSQRVERRPLSSQDAADLFVYFYAVGFFEPPGDAGRGKALFRDKGCEGCHAAGKARPVSEWSAVDDPIRLAGQMWNHATRMQEAMGKQNIPSPVLTAQDLRDLCVYAQTLPQARGRTPDFKLERPETGEGVFRTKGCAECHTGRQALEGKLGQKSLTEIAAALWNHSPRMIQMPPPLSEEEMRQLLSYVWAKQFLDGDGNASRGKGVFSRKNCAVCHAGGSAGAPPLPAAAGASSSSMIAGLWGHGPAMLAEMRNRKLPWPRFRASEMADLVAYLNAPPSGAR